MIFLVINHSYNTFIGSVCYQTGANFVGCVIDMIKSINDFQIIMWDNHLNRPVIPQPCMGKIWELKCWKELIKTYILNKKSS